MFVIHVAASNDGENAIALEAFDRLAIAATEPRFGDISTALDEFLTF